VYVVVTTGFTVVLPISVGLTSPIPWSMLSPVAPVTSQDRVVDCPSLIDAGAAANPVTTGFVFTVTVTLAVFVPAAFVAVTVYVVVTAGITG